MSTVLLGNLNPYERMALRLLALYLLMLNFPATLVATLPSILRSRAALELGEPSPSAPDWCAATLRPKAPAVDRLFWSWVSTSSPYRGEVKCRRWRISSCRFPYPSLTHPRCGPSQAGRINILEADFAPEPVADIEV